MPSIRTAVYGDTALAAIVSAAPSPGAQGEQFLLSNDETSVLVQTSSPGADAAKNHQAMTVGNVDCKGSAFCERLGSNCDDAYRKVVPSNTYSTHYDKANTGTCSGTCGLFVSGNHCQVTGQDLKDVYNDIRNKGHCTHCGRKQIADGCMIKIDRVTGC